AIVGLARWPANKIDNRLGWSVGPVATTHALGCSATEATNPLRVAPGHRADSAAPEWSPAPSATTLMFRSAPPRAESSPAVARQHSAAFRSKPHRLPLPWQSSADPRNRENIVRPQETNAPPSSLTPQGKR